MLDNEPDNLAAIVAVDRRREILLLHADTLYLSNRSLLPSQAHAWRQFEPNRLAQYPAYSPTTDKRAELKATSQQVIHIYGQIGTVLKLERLSAHIASLSVGKTRHDTMRTILFLCSGNCYRSRFAEYYFNDRARRIDLDWLAVSRGLAKECGVCNVDLVSPLTLSAIA